MTAPLAGVDPSVWAPFDRAVAVNVNVFWTGAAEAELAALARLLTPDGVLHLVYEPPAAERLEPLRAGLAEHLSTAGWRWAADAGGASGRSHGLLRVRAQPGP